MVDPDLGGPTYCISINTTYTNQQVLIVFLSSLVFGIFLFILFLVLRFLLWEFGKQNVYHWRRDSIVNDCAENPLIQNDDTEEEYAVAREHSFFNWIRNYIMLGLNNFREKVGVDAYLYQIFQLHLLLLMMCYVFFCVFIILPVNVAYCSRDDFKISQIVTTSISACLACGHQNLGILWLHSIVNHVLVVIGFSFGLSFLYIYYRCEYKGDFQINAIQIKHVKKPHNQEEAKQILQSLHKHFLQTAEEPISIEFAYDVAKFDSLNNQLNEAKKSLENYELLEEMYGIKQYVYTGLSRFVSWKKPVVAIDYYEERIEILKCDMEKEKAKALLNPQSVVFVEFPEEFDISIVYNRYISYVPFYRPQSDESRYLNHNRWKVKRAPSPYDLNWANIRTFKLFRAIWYFRLGIVNIGIILFFLFFTTPNGVINILNMILGSVGMSGNTTANSNSDIEPLYSLIDKLLSRFGISNSTVFDATRSLALAYAGPLLQILLAALIPLIISYAAHYEYRWSKASTMRASICKTYLYLLMMLLVFPSFSFTSYILAMDLIVRNREGANSTMEKFASVTSNAFAPDTGIFFMNYLNISAFFVIIQIFRIPSLLVYLYNKLSARSELETNQSHESYSSLFNFGIEYAWVLAKISIAIVYGSLFPLITVSGLLYLMMKMAVDRYNLIYQARRPRGFSGSTSVHRYAFSFLCLSLLLSEIYILILSIMQFSYKSGSVLLLAINSTMLILTFAFLIVLLILLKCIRDCRSWVRGIFKKKHGNTGYHPIVNLNADESQLEEPANKHVYNYFNFIEEDKVSETITDETEVM